MEQEHHKIYTKVGDKGTTVTYGGELVAKDDPIVIVNGDIDNLLAGLDIAKTFVEKPYVKELIRKIEEKLWQLGGEISLGYVGKKIVKPITENDLHWIEVQIDRLGEPPTKFIRFEKRSAIFLNEARVRCRQLERTLTKYLRDHEMRSESYKYINRLGDLLFMMAYVEEKG